MANEQADALRLPDRDDLARLLAEAAEAHHVYEQELGRPDGDWPGWYAQYIIDRVRKA